MLPESVELLQTSVLDDAQVLDVGGWAKPLGRANWVIDLMPYDTRGLYGTEDGLEERFGAASWVQRDICAREPWPFADDQFDFAVCSHTLEDVRDPVFACSELARVAKAGYIEVPSRLEEQSYGFQGPWAGWGHHHWFCDVDENGIEFVFKHHVLHGRESDHFPAWFQQGLTPQQRVQSLWWEGGFRFGERVILEADELDTYLAGFVAEHAAEVERPKRRWRSG
ncbi:MAG: methyltransferase domain-containing protein [Thermoleophilaceae bacterium]|nr:methyltransferase domain-containing protein [Thermoleophilaceae bacterium]